MNAWLAFLFIIDLMGTLLPFVPSPAVL